MSIRFWPVEGRWNIHGPWHALVFGGGGRIAEDVGDLGSSPTHFAGGFGVRYMIAREQKLSGRGHKYGNAPRWSSRPERKA